MKDRAELIPKVSDVERLVRSVACPTCGAVVDMACFQDNGRSGARVQAHRARFLKVLGELDAPERTEER